MAPYARDDEQVVAFLARAGLPAARIAGYAPLTGGTYNTLYVIELRGGGPAGDEARHGGPDGPGGEDGERLVLKVPPPSDVPRLRYEAELLRGETLFYEHAAALGVPAPRVVHAECAEDAGAEPFLLMTHRPGVPWYSVAEETAAPERDRLRRELGTLTAALHTVRGPGFGYPAQSTGPLTGSWRDAFTAMTGAVLADAEAYRPWLPLPAAAVRAALAEAAPVLDEVTVPALVHFDLWPGNILLNGPAGERTVSGLIDGERMLWGDPLADFASMSLLLGEVEDDPAFVAGYAAGGGRAQFDGSARRRIALYRCYLYLIMLTEAVPRRYEGEHLTWVREFVGPRLVAALRAASPAQV